jgi:hypothetical protein
MRELSSRYFRWIGEPTRITLYYVVRTHARVCTYGGMTISGRKYVGTVTKIENRTCLLGILCNAHVTGSPRFYCVSRSTENKGKKKLRCAQVRLRGVRVARTDICNFKP